MGRLFFFEETFMDIQGMITRQVEKGRGAFSEFDSKKVLAHYGIPVCAEYLTHSADEAVEKAGSIGYPVVLKACSHAIAHKTEKGLVETGLGSSRAVTEGFERIEKNSKETLEGVLVQETVKGARELMLGLVRDPQFGPCVMAGLGGVLTEIVRDISFRMAPVEEIEARDMLAELRSNDILGNFRGQAPADGDALCRAVAAVGRIGLEHTGVAEIDINPVIIRPDGSFAAVDALIVLKGGADD